MTAIKIIGSAMILTATLASCVPPGQVAEQRCAAAGFGPGDPNAYECYNAEMNRMNAANAAILGASVGMMNAGRPVFPPGPTYVIQPGYGEGGHYP